jgi:hypothetical protein
MGCAFINQVLSLMSDERRSRGDCDLLLLGWLFQGLALRVVITSCLCVSWLICHKRGKHSMWRFWCIHVVIAGLGMLCLLLLASVRAKVRA